MTQNYHIRKIADYEPEKGILYVPEELKKILPLRENQEVLVNCEEYENTFKYNFNRLERRFKRLL